MIKKYIKKRQLDSVPASVSIKKIGKKDPESHTTIFELINDFQDNGILFAMIFFALPIAVPLPYPPGFTTLVGIPLLILSYQLLIGSKTVKLPQKINEYKIKNSLLNSISNKMVPIVESIEKYIKPRYGFAKSVYCEQLIGLISLIASIAISIPLPFTNAIPALGITVMCLGQLNRDGLVVGCGILISLIGTLIASAIVFGGVALIKSLSHFVF
ncbi:MAG: exopolysaccharide biosynthesis protein [Rickettsiaceae bacterium]|nr:exopolysaccharide biosynthesis protein [Rickettsiaceae bacterium]